MSVRSALAALIRGPQPDYKAMAAAAIPFAGAGAGSSWSRSIGWDGNLPSTKIDFASEAGDLTQSSAVMACLNWITRTFPEAPIQVKAGKGQDAEVVPDHPLTALLAKPNPFYSGLLLWAATLASWHLDGNAYWLKVRSGRGDVLQLWYEPHFTIGPTWDSAGTSFITGYRLWRNGTPYDVGVDDVVHFRYGINPLNPRLGLSPLASALREVFTDNEGANYSAAILRNMGVPGLLISPGTPDGVIDDPPALKRDILAKTSGDQRGQPLVMGLPVKMERLAFNPVEMNTREVRRIPEERIAALIGIPAVVVGLGAGLDRNTFANARESREAAYESCIVPTQRLFGAELDVQLLPDLSSATDQHVGFDLTQVRALQDDRDKLVARTVMAFKGGVIRRSEARKALGEKVDTGDELFANELVTIRETLTDALGAPLDVAPSELLLPPGGSAPNKPRPAATPPGPPAKRLKSSNGTVTLSAEPVAADVAGVQSAYAAWAAEEQDALWPKEP